MAFDVKGALAEGYSPTEIADHLASRRKFDIAGARAEGYSDDEIISHLTRSATGGMGESLTGGVKRNISSIRTGLGSLFGGNEAAVEGLARQAKITERPGGSIEEVKRKYREDGLLSAAGEAISQIPGVLSEQAPFIGEMAAGARAGAMLPVPPQLRPITALIGAGVAPFISQAGSNVERQAQEQQAQGKPVDVSTGTAYASALPQAALDVVGLKFGLGRLLGINKNKLGTEAAETLAREKLVPSIAKGTGKTALAEVPTEVTQQMLERAQAGLSLTDKEAIDEYANAAYQAALMSPLGGVTRRMEVSDAVAKQEEEKNKKLTEINAERKRQANIAAEAQAQYAATTAAQKRIIDEHVKAAPNRPLIDIINEVTGVSTPKTKVTKAAVNAALNESSGVRVNDENGVERELTMGELQARQNPHLFTEEARQVLALPPATQAPLISFPDGSVGTENDAVDYIGSLPEGERVAARAKLFGYAPQVTSTAINNTTLTSLVPTLKPSAGIFKRLAKLGNIDSDVKLNTLYSELDKLGTAHAVNETKLKEIEDGYKQVQQQAKATERAVTTADRETIGDSIQGLGEPGGGGSAIAPGVGGVELGGVDVAGPPLRESVDGTSGLNAPVEAVAPESTEVMPTAEELMPTLEEVPVEMPVEAAPIEEAPVDMLAEVPVQEAPAEIPVEAAIEEAPVEMPIEAAIEEAPIEMPIEAPVEAAPSPEELQLINKAMKQVPGSPAQKATLTKIENIKQARSAPAPTQAPSPLAALVKSTLEAKEKDATKNKKSLSKKAVDDRISNKEAISDHIDSTLTAEEENLVAEELGDGDYEAGKEKLVKLVAQSMAGKAISGIKLAIRNLVKKIQAGLMAMVISFNFNPNIPVIDVGVPIEVSAYTLQVDTQGKPMGEMAQKVAAHALNKGNGKAFIIADKPNEMLYAFNNNGVLLGKTVMLTGKGIGDVREKMNLSPWEVASEKQVTPAGTFTGKFKFNKHYGSIITLAETQDGAKTVIAIHKTPVFSKQAREAQLASPTIKDNRATQGCLNAPDKFYDEVIAPNFQGESQIYVMPDQSDAVSFFGIQETETKTVYGTTAEAEGTQQTVGREEEGAVAEERQAAVPTAPPVKEPKVKEDIDAAIETAKAELGAAIRNTFGVAAMAVPESGGGVGNLLKALSNLMFLLIRKGVKSMGQAISMSRKAAGSAANKITPSQYRDAYAEAKARDAGAEALPANEQSLFDDTAEFVPPSVGKTDSVLDFIENIDVNRINGENLGDFVTDARIKVVYSGAGIEDALSKKYEGAVTDALTNDVRADIAMSQALSGNKMAAESAMVGKVIFDDNSLPKIVDDPNTLNAIQEKLASLADKIGIDKAKHAAQAYLVALRYKSWLELNKSKDKDIATAKANKKYDLARKIEGQKKFVSEAQEAAIPAGLQFADVYPEVREISDIYEAVKNNEIDMLEAAGYYSKELADEYRKTKGYVPLFRVMDDIESSAPGAKQYFRGFADIGAEKKATGSSRQVDDVFDNMMTRHMWAVNAAIRNNANRLAADQLGLVGKDGKLILTTKIEEGAEKRSAPLWVDGERMYVQYSDPKLAVGIQGLEPALGPLFNFFAGASNLLRMGVTILPPFQLAMVFHDAPRAALLSGVNHPYKLMGKVVTSFAAILKDPNDPFVQEMRRLGISGGYGHTAAEVSAKLRRDLGLEANGLVRKALDKAEVFAAASDLAQRRAIYMQTLEETGNKVLAMHRALDIINFQKHGASAKVRALTQIVPFMNAYIQGMDVLYKAMAGKGISGKEKRQAQVLFMQTAIKLAALSALYSMLVADDEDYQRLDDREKVRSLIIPGTGVKIPVAADVAMLVKTIPELGYQYMVRSGTDNPMDATKLFQGVSDSLKDGLLGPNLTPQFLRTGVEVALNKNFMTGQPIVGRGLENLATSEQFTENTSRLARLIGQTGILSPMSADHLMKGYGGTTASLFLYTTDGLVNQVAEVKTPTTPIYRIPSINAFFYSTQGKDQLNDYYDLKDRSDEVTATLNRYIKTGNLEEAQAYAAENQSMLGVRNVVNKLTTHMTSLREIRKQIIAGNMDADEKRKRLDEIDTSMAQMMKRIGFIRDKAGL